MAAQAPALARTEVVRVRTRAFAAVRPWLGRRERRILGGERGDQRVAALGLGRIPVPVAHHLRPAQAGAVGVARERWNCRKRWRAELPEHLPKFVLVLLRGELNLYPTTSRVKSEPP